MYLHDDLVFQAEHLHVRQLGEAHLGLTVVWVSNHEQQVDEGILDLLKLANPVDGHLGYDRVHEHLDARLVTWRHNLLLARLALFDSLGEQLQTEWVQIVLEPWLPVDILQALVQPGHLVDVKFSLQRLIKRQKGVLSIVTLANHR